MKKTILHISKYYHPYLGGIETVAKQVVDGLSTYNNIVVCFSSDKDTHIDYVDGVKIIRIGVVANISSQDISFSYYSTLRKLIRTEHPLAIHLHCPNPFVYPFVLTLIPQQTKLVLHWHSDIIDKGRLYTLVHPFEKQILSRADTIIATSSNYLNGSQVLLPWREKVIIIPNVIATSQFVRQESDQTTIDEIRAKWQNKHLLFFCGRHVAYKGINQLIASASYMDEDIQILIAGDGPLTPQYQKMAKNSSNITFLGRISDDELRCYLYASDAFAFPSINKAEAFGVALAEAMFCGCVPVVFTLNGSGVNWVNINHETGLEVPINDVYAYAKAVCLLMKSDELRHQMSINAQKRICDLFVTERLFQQINKLYNQIV
ncbi:MAG: glycosyltransferase [Paludibacteraceae bacterium]|nr:glycosyltransferase [Paludibacteraceae bacterium]